MDAYTGAIFAFGFGYTPSGDTSWALCNGQLLNISDFPYLFKLIGTKYGGDGITKFAVPDLQGRVPVSQSQAPGLQMYTLGEKGGSTTTPLTADNLPQHTHAVASATLQIGEMPNTNNPANAYFATPNQNIYQGTTNIQMGANKGNSSAYAPNASPMPIDIMTPYMVLNYCICTYGINTPIPTPTGNGEKPQTDTVTK